MSSHIRRATKIVATLGPASNSPEVIEQLILAGLDVARLNFSHGTPDEHKAPVMGRSNEGKPGTRKLRYGKTQRKWGK